MRANSNYKIDLLLFQVSKLWLKSKKQILDKFDLTYSQFETLEALYNLKNLKQEIIQINISKETGFDPMTTSFILRSLEEKRFITRRRGHINTRVVFVDLTHKGFEVYEKAFDEICKTSRLLYSKVDSQQLSSELLIISKELNKINI